MKIRARILGVACVAWWTCVVGCGSATLKTGADGGVGTGGNPDGGGRGGSGSGGASAGGSGATGTGGAAGAGTGVGGATGAGGSSAGTGGTGAGGIGGAPVVCSSTQHNCGGTCVDNNSIQHCGSLCGACTPPTGATATCDGTDCGYTCGGTVPQNCPTQMICVASSGCCSNTDCPAMAGGQTGTCDTGTHTCNYSCPASTTKSCTANGTTTCIPTSGCCANSDCAGTCMSCNSSHVCVAATGQDDPNGRCAGTCDASGACKSKQGQVCNTVTGGCVGGTTCSQDGYCCNTACTGPCMACDYPGQQGTCKSLAQNETPHTGHGNCNGVGTTCAGSCNGSGVCSYGTEACGGGPICSGTGLVGPSTCSSGSCVAPAAQACGGDFVCSANACKTSCTADADCVTGDFCQTGTCHLGAVAIAAGAAHTCALLRNGSLRCWGENDHGELGIGTFNTTGFNGIATPTAVPGLSKPVTAVTAEDEGTCALLNDGTVWCWGYNNDGDLGIGTFSSTGNDSVGSPTKVMGLGGAATQISGGHAHGCALVGSAAWCWGENYNGELGNGVFNTSPPVGSATAIEVSGLGSVTQISAGEDFTCALAAGVPYCWGWNQYGQLGDNMYGNEFATPQTVGLTTTTTIAALVAGSGSEACALLGGGNVYCWGYNLAGELGDGFFSTDSPNAYATPVPVTGGVSAVTSVAVGSGSGCALNGDGTVACWGDNEFGELGNGSIITGAPYGIDTAGAVTGLPGPSSAIAAGGGYNCALIKNGSVWCWGANGNGQLGNGTENMSSIPVQVSGW